MKQNKSGWHGESRRHSLARKGVKTVPMTAKGRTVTQQFEVFSYNELPENVKDKVIMEHWDINVDWEWYEFTLDYFAEKLEEEYGISVDPRKIYFNLDRGYYLYLDNAYVSDDKKFLKFLGVDLRTKFAKDVLSGEDDIMIKVNHFGGSRAENWVAVGSGCHNQIEYTEALNDMLDDLRIELQKEYDQLTSEESIVDTILANEYEFTKDGKIFR